MTKIEIKVLDILYDKIHFALLLNGRNGRIDSLLLTIVDLIIEENSNLELNKEEIIKLFKNWREKYKKDNNSEPIKYHKLEISENVLESLPDLEKQIDSLLKFNVINDIFNFIENEYNPGLNNSEILGLYNE